ncbi:MAG: hypothetical protein M5U28_56510 [Sandaracinaceae bacterium]|nr:hypothetical protein [Sandaracinaceae bacterium]
MIEPRRGSVRCLLVRPEFLEHTFYNPRELFRTLGAETAAPPLGLLITAALLPPSGSCASSTATSIPSRTRTWRGPTC